MLPRTLIGAMSPQMSVLQRFGTPALDLNLAGDSTLDPRITATRASTKTYFDSTGTMQTAAVNEFPSEYDPSTLVCLGRSFWESRTNLVTYSQEVDNAAWTKSASTSTANATTAPDGTTTADKWVESATLAYHNINSAVVSISAGQTLTGSMFFKAAERSVLWFEITDPTFTARCYARFNLSSLAITSVTTLGGATSVGQSIQSVGNGWYRCITTVTLNGAYTTARLNVGLDNGTINLYTGDGTSGLYAWGGQLEVGATPTPYIPTTSASVTRAADVVSMTGTNFSSWYNQTEGTFLCNSSTTYTSSNFPTHFSVSDGTANNTIYANSRGSTTSTRMESYVGGVTQVAAINSTTATASGVMSSTLRAYKLNDYGLSCGGETVLTDTVATVPTVDKLTLGAAYNGGAMLNGFISRLVYWPSRLPASDMSILSRST